MDKYSFIEQLLENEKFNSSQKERLLKLSIHEIKVETSKDVELLKRIKEIEDKLNIGNEIIKDTKPPIGDNNTQKKIKYVRHDNLPRYLRDLNSNDYTKFLTHSIDSSDINELIANMELEEYDFQIHLIKIKEVFDVLTNYKSIYKSEYPFLESYFLSPNFYMKIKNYINGNPWSLKKINMNWSNPNLHDWVRKNPGKTPLANEENLGYEGFYFSCPELNNENMSFVDLLIYFKNEVHIRKSNSLISQINSILNNPEYKFDNRLNVDNKIPVDIDFYTDVEKLKEAMKLIFSLIIEKHEKPGKPKVLFSVLNEKKLMTLTISHLENTFAQNNETIRIGKSFANLIKELNGICNIEILAKFSDSNSYKLPLWSVFGNYLKNQTLYNSEGKVLDLSEMLIPMEQSINGVQYNLIFHKGL